MKWDEISPRWKDVKGKVKEKWGRLTDDDIDAISGDKDRLIGRLQERYGKSHKEAEEQLKSFFSDLEGDPDVDAP
jgi:uncharacterized protein YjbJ (UPF0337 family)